jgi:hypothetical protein
VVKESSQQADNQTLASPALSDSTFPLSLNFGHPPPELGCGNCSAWQGLLFLVVLGKVARRHAQLENRDFALSPLSYAEGHHRCADACTDIDRTPVVICLPRSIEAVQILVPADLPQGDFVQARQRDLTAMGVAGKNQRDTVRPQHIGFLCDVG